ncbi:M28 family peptidase [Fulvivirgaceae bacterium BMA10]|uniref:M28 family peptidase n=1 Tax=Splendidivirga corallicola TaxID=3051826 RepID=A0ABT8KQX8_9BACT|nr:M28 family peptidase [Fulvivirgaceae bacterium BMA10]
MYYLKLIFRLSLSLILFSSSAFSQQKFDAIELLENFRILSSDEYGGRGTGQPGNKKARKFLVKKFKEAGLTPFGKSYLQPFDFIYKKTSEHLEGANVIGQIKGKKYPDKYIVIGAHYDHLGIQNGAIFNGADDNTSGTCALLALSQYFRQHTPDHSIIIAAFDAEEKGLIGSKHFVDNPPVPLEQMILNITMDMISRNIHHEIYIAGTYHYPFLKAPLEKAIKKSHLKVSFGHDVPDDKEKDDWTYSSDNAPFHIKNIPFAAFEVEDHPDYHKATDEFKHIEPAFYLEVVGLIINAVVQLDHDFENLKNK